MTKNEVWTIEELIALTDEVQKGEVEFQGKPFNFQYCELTEGEEPKIAMPEGDLTDEETNKAYQEIATERVLAMVDKANEKNPSGATLERDSWSKLPSTIRWSISSLIIGGSQDVSTNFRKLDEDSS